MKNLTLNLEEEISILNKYRITPNELLLIKTLLILQEDGNEELFKSYIESLYVCKVKLREILLCLQEKGIINKVFNIPKEGDPFDPYSIPFNKTFVKNLYKCSFELGKELFENYPRTTTINGCIVPLRTVSKHFNSLEDCYFRYGKSIGWDIEKHSEIIKLLKWSKDYNILSCSLSSFVINNGWLDLQHLKEEGDASNINYDAIKML